jgi:hypothetical protein
LLRNWPGICHSLFFHFPKPCEIHKILAPDNALWDRNLKSGSLMLNSLHLKCSEDCYLNLITVGKLNTEVNRYVPWNYKFSILEAHSVSIWLVRRNSFYFSYYSKYMNLLCNHFVQIYVLFLYTYGKTNESWKTVRLRCYQNGDIHLLLTEF